MSVNYTPELQPYKSMGAFRFWCQKVLPLVYDDSLSYYELLCKVVNYLNTVISNTDNMHTDIENLLAAYNQLQAWVNNYFDNLDVQDEINNKLDAMVEDGTMNTIINQQIFGELTDKTNTLDFDITLSHLNESRVIYEECNPLGSGDDLGYAASQGMCAIDDTHIAMAFLATNNNSTPKSDAAKIQVVDLTDGSKREAILMLGHANSLTYNPDDNVIYCAPSSFPSNASERVIFEIDYDSLTLLRTIPLTLPTVNAGATAIAYDRDNHRIIMRNNNYIFVYDNQFNYISTVELEGNVGVSQGMEYVKGYIIQNKMFGGTYASRIKGTVGNVIQTFY